MKNSTEKAINLINSLQKTHMLLLYAMKYFIVIMPLFFIHSYAQEKEDEGTCIRTINNNKDIYHQKNDFVRKEMKERALLDLIERGGASWNFESNTQTKKVSLQNANGNENYLDEYAEKWLGKQNLSFNRTSSYDFEKIENRKWKVKVRGIIKNIEIEDISDDSFNDDNENINLYKDKKNTILRKSFNRVIIRNSPLSKSNDRFKVWGYKERRTIAGTKKIRKLKGLLTVKKTQDEGKMIEAKILKGFWRIKREDEVTREYFRYSRSGIELGYSYQSFYNNNTTKFNVLRFSYFFQSLKSKLGFALGCDMINYSSPKISNNSELVSTPIFFPNLNFDYSIGLIPDLLFLKPGFRIGYLLKNLKIDENDWKLFEVYKNTRVMIRPALYLSLRFKSIDFSGGFSFILDRNSINNFSVSNIEKSLFPSFSVMFNFRKN